MDIRQIYDAVIEGDADQVRQLTEEALTAGLSAIDIVNEGLIPGMNEVGRLMKEGEYYLPEVLISARAMQAGMSLVRPLLTETQQKSRGVIVLATVQGDLHDIGKNLVAMMLEGAGFRVIDLGIDKSPDAFVSAVREHQPDVLGMSALLTTTMSTMRQTIQALEEAGLRGTVKVVVGGAPVTQRFADDIKADGYAPDASAAVDLVKALLGHQ